MKNNFNYPREVTSWREKEEYLLNEVEHWKEEVARERKIRKKNELTFSRARIKLESVFATLRCSSRGEHWSN
jgi:hypothetical protein